MCVNLSIRYNAMDFNKLQGSGSQIFLELQTKDYLIPSG